MENQSMSLFNTKFLKKWHRNYDMLKNQVNKNPLCTYDEELVQWVSIQRRIRYMLPRELKDKLADLDAAMQHTATSWNLMYKQLVLFVQKNGHTALPDDKEHEQLKDWLVRQMLNKPLLSESQFQQLDKLEVDWEMPISRDHRWNQMYLKLHDFYRTFGHCRVPLQWPKDKQLARWVSVQRRMHRLCRLIEERERRLNELNFTWSVQEVYDARWEAFFLQLVTFSKQYGHCQVPCKDEKLVSWIERQRLARKKGRLTQDRVKQLEEIGFVWSCDDLKWKDWEKRYHQLEEYSKKFGYSSVSTNCREYRSLGIWVATQRGLEAKGKLEASKKIKLDKLGFVWSKDVQDTLQSVYDRQWNDSFEKLKAYSQKHAICQVSLKIDPVLQRWTSWQRKLFYQGKLSPERIDRLNEIRFPWSVQEGYWLKMYEALIAFKEKFKHTRVPFQWTLNPALSAWVYRIRLNKEELSIQKVELLEQIGFDWALNRRSLVPWEAMYDRLVKFKQKQGHTHVPVKWHEDPKLGKWVSRMRQEREKLDPERVSLLEAIGFEWGHPFKRKKYTTINHNSQELG